MVEFFAWVILILILTPIALLVLAVPVTILTVLIGGVVGGIASLVGKK